MTARLKVLIVGGYGTFGGRLARLLDGEPGLDILVAGRSYDKANRFCAAHMREGTATPCRFDRDGDIDAQLAELEPDVVVDASGPFQDYAGDPYRLVRACIGCGSDYLDIADGTEFVAGITAFDQAARGRGCFILSGASSYPALSAAATHDLARSMTHVESLVACIAPSPFVQLGSSVVRAGVGYGGRPITVIRNGRPMTAYALTESRRATIAPPGGLPLKTRLFSLVDVPDLQLLPSQFPGLKSLWLGFGPAPDLAQRGLNLAAWLVRLRLLPSLKPFAGAIARAANVLRWGEPRSGMLVALGGRLGDGTRGERSWHLVAEGDDGPFIPAMACAAVILHCRAGRRPMPGARPATTDISLGDYETLFSRFAIVTGVRETGPGYAALPLYQRLLGSAWERLPGPVRALHDVEGVKVAEGRASVDRGTAILARLAAAVFRFPSAGDDVPVRVTFTSTSGRETWLRRFAGRSLGSTQWQGRGRSAYLLNERFGPATFGLALVLDDDRLHLVLRRWWMFGVTLPLAWAPRGEAYEFARDGLFHFHVEISHPLTGFIVRYRGWLRPQPAAASVAGSLARPKVPGTAT